MATISQIDKEITAVRRELRRRERIDTVNPASWQRAWDRHPELHARELDLFRQRGEAQRIRAEREAKAARNARVKRPKICPKCGAPLFYADAA